MVLHVIGGPRTFLGQICVKYIACWIQNYVLKNPQWNLLLEKNSCHSKKCILISPYTAWMFISRAFWTQNTIVHTWTGCRWTEAKPEFTQSKSRLCTVKPSSILLAVQSPTRFPIMLLELLWLFFYTLWLLAMSVHALHFSQKEIWFVSLLWGYGLVLWLAWVYGMQPTWWCSGHKPRV